LGTKFQKLQDDFGHGIKDSLAGIFNTLQNKNIMDTLIEHLRDKPETVRHIRSVEVAVHEAEAATLWIDFTEHSELGRLFDLKSLPGIVDGRIRTGYRSDEQVIQVIREYVLGNVHEYSRFETKISALNALCTTAQIMTKAWHRRGIRAPSLNGEVPRVIVNGMLNIGHLLSDAEIDGIKNQSSFLERVQSPRRFRTTTNPQKTPFVGLACFLGLFLDGSVPIDFHRPSEKIEYALKGSRVYPNQYRDIKNIILYDIHADINHKSCFKTRLNALKTLTDIGYTFIDRSRRWSGNPQLFKDGKLDKLLTDTMLNI
jgi:hypothetical protein